MWARRAVPSTWWALESGANEWVNELRGEQGSLSRDARRMKHLAVSCIPGLVHHSFGSDGEFWVLCLLESPTRQMSTCPRSTPALRPRLHPRWSPSAPMGSPGRWPLKAWLGSSTAICRARSLQIPPAASADLLGGGHSFVVEQGGATLERKGTNLKTWSATHNFKIKCRL